MHWVDQSTAQSTTYAFNRSVNGPVNHIHVQYVSYYLSRYPLYPMRSWASRYTAPMGYGWCICHAVAMALADAFAMRWVEALSDALAMHLPCVELRLWVMHLPCICYTFEWYICYIVAMALANAFAMCWVKAPNNALAMHLPCISMALFDGMAMQLPYNRLRLRVIYLP